MPCKGELVERTRSITYASLPPNSTLKKVAFALLPYLQKNSFFFISFDYYHEYTRRSLPK